MQLAFTAAGMITSVGFGAASSCAAIRAGIARPAPVEFFAVLDEEAQEEVPVCGHPVAGYTDGFVGAATWRVLARSALEDLARDPTLPGRSDRAFWERTGVLFVLPELDPSRFDDDGETTAEGLRSELLDPLCGGSGLPLSHVREVLCRGHAGAVHALSRAREILEGGAADRAVVLGVDSYLDPALRTRVSEAVDEPFWTEASLTLGESSETVAMDLRPREDATLAEPDLD